MRFAGSALEPEPVFLTPGPTPMSNGESDPAGADAQKSSERRGPSRKSVTIPALAVCPDGSEFRCIMRDISPSGAKLGLSSRHRLPSRFKIVTGNRPQGFPVRLVWQRGDFAGVALVIEDG